MARETRNLSGKVVAITGGARGIGFATAQACARKGMAVALGDLDASLASESAGKLGGDKHLGLALDVTDRKSFEAFLDQVEERLGPVDVLINNAGIMPVGNFVDESDETAHRMVDINLHGVIYGCKLAMPKMTARRSGHIVNIASMAGKGGFPQAATYCATKHAVVGLSEAIRAELVDTGVDVSYVMPSFVDTELTVGLKGSKAIKTVEPSLVADLTVDALETGRVEVFVPKSNGPISRVLTLLPRGAREKLGHALGGDTALETVDPSTRKVYEDRAAQSEPSRDPERETEKV
jgi:NAD(P)-dependent dehydrogenase (short-subunit alcohol dehydrogenase family)